MSQYPPPIYQDEIENDSEYDSEYDFQRQSDTTEPLTGFNVSYPAKFFDQPPKNRQLCMFTGAIFLLCFLTFILLCVSVGYGKKSIDHLSSFDPNQINTLLTQFEQILANNGTEKLKLIIGLVNSETELYAEKVLSIIDQACNNNPYKC